MKTWKVIQGIRSLIMAEGLIQVALVGSIHILIELEALAFVRPGRRRENAKTRRCDQWDAECDYCCRSAAETAGHRRRWASPATGLSRRCRRCRCRGSTKSSTAPTNRERSRCTPVAAQKFPSIQCPLSVLFRKLELSKVNPSLPY